MSLRRACVLVGFALLAALPLIADLIDEPFYLRLFTRIMIFAIAAVSLDLILGFGGMVSFGHAAFVGIGAYVVGILSFHAAEGSLLLGVIPGTGNALVAWPAAVLCAAGAAVAIGAISLRTSGVYFIMITLAFAQMLYFFFSSLQRYGGEDGLQLANRSILPGIDLDDRIALYYVTFTCLTLCTLGTRRLVDSRFGMVIQGCRQNERRMRALGFAPFRYKLVAFVLSGAMAGLAGVLLANNAAFVSPADMAWTRSGEIMVMVILGGMSTLYGPIAGAAAFILLELALDSVTTHWQVVMGPTLILVVLFAKRGLFGLLPASRRR
jgi:branched-chain amino acid transport system permease protein